MDKILLAEIHYGRQRVVGMYFAKRRQNITLYKGNNIGDDVSQELTSSLFWYQ